MKKCGILKGKLILLLVTAILVLCVGFFIVGCGVGPATKATSYDDGNFAVDFNAASGSDVVALNVSNTKFPTIAGNNLTIEAWVKPKASSTTPGGIFGRYDAKGAALWVTSAVPKFGIRVFNTGAASSTDYSVSGTAMTNNTWYHIAGVLTSTAHTHTATTSCTTAAMAETPHLDLYVNGTFVDCASTWGDADDPATEEQGVSDPNKKGSGSTETDNAEIGYINNLLTPLIDSVDGGNFEGVIDDVRLWNTDRSITPDGESSNYINLCMNAELSLTSANCNMHSTALIGYWMMNEGSGYDIHDSSGSALNGAMEVGTSYWSNGWVTGKFE